MSLTPYVHLATGCLHGASEGDEIALAADARAHLERVLRLAPGAPLVVADGEGRQADATLGAGSVRLRGAVAVDEAPAPTLHLVQALAKGRKVDDIVRAATELGVDRITIVRSRRSVAPDGRDKADRMVQRWRAVALAASSQARRPRLPVVDGPIELASLTALLAPGTVGLVGHPEGATPLRTALSGLDPAAVPEVVAAIGPEGGWDASDLDIFEGFGFDAVRLGATVLRTEHAGHALCALVALHLGRFD